MDWCNVTSHSAPIQMTSHLYYDIKLSMTCLSYAVNMVLSAPLLLAIARAPSLLGKLRFLLLAHLLCCNNLQLLVLTVESALLASRPGITVTQCMIFTAASQICILVDVLMSAALAVDRCVAIKWPLQYELLLGPVRRRALVAGTWTLSLLVSLVALCLALESVRTNAVVPRCRLSVVTCYLWRTSALQLYYTLVSSLVLPACYLTMLGCFLLLCWGTRGLLRSRRARVTLLLQAAQMLFYSVPVLLDSYLIPCNLHCDSLDIAASTLYDLGISLVPLVYGYRSRELQKRLQQTAVRHPVSPAQ